MNQINVLMKNFKKIFSHIFCSLPYKDTSTRLPYAKQKTSLHHTMNLVFPPSRTKIKNFYWLLHSMISSPNIYSCYTYYFFKIFLVHRISSTLHSNPSEFLRNLVPIYHHSLFLGGFQASGGKCLVLLILSWQIGV